MSPAEYWSRALAAWAIPEPILARAPQSPWGCDVGRFTQRAASAAQSPSPASHHALAVLDSAASVLDVGCGAGAASVSLAPPATRLIGVDQSTGMLAAFARGARERSVEVATVEGAWPDVAPTTEVADVVVCHDVLHNVAEATPFIRALTDHARRRVVIVAPMNHPQAWLNPYWEDLHGLDRPTGPSADDLRAVIEDEGLTVEREMFTEPTWWRQADTEDLVVTVRRRLCLTTEDDGRIRKAVARHGAPLEREAVALCWDGWA